MGSKKPHACHGSKHGIWVTLHLLVGILKKWVYNGREIPILRLMTNPVDENTTLVLTMAHIVGYIYIYPIKYPH